QVERRPCVEELPPPPLGAAGPRVQLRPGDGCPRPAHGHLCTVARHAPFAARRLHTGLSVLWSVGRQRELRSDPTAELGSGHRSDTGRIALPAQIPANFLLVVTIRTVPLR